MRRLSALLLGTFAWLLASQAYAWEPFKRPNPDVESGNQNLAKGNAKEALKAYDRAALELPERPEVQLNRALALLAAKQWGPAREAALRATEPPSSSKLRAKAYATLGHAFFREATEQAKNKQHQEASRLFRESMDAFRQSLRAHPGQAHAAWNYELAKERVREQQEAQKKEDEKQQKQDQDKQKQDDSDNSSSDDSQRDPNDSTPPDQDEDKQSKPPEQDSKKDQDPPQQDPDSKSQSPDEEKQQKQPSPPEQPKSKEGRPLPSDARRLLDSLKENEKSLQREQARSRGQHQRPPEKDW